MQFQESCHRADLFHQLHRGPSPLVVIAAWDRASAAILETAGAHAISTTACRADLVAAVCRAVSVPVSVDFNNRPNPESPELDALLEQFIEAGVAGVDIGAEHIRTVRATAARRGARLFINARIETRQYRATVDEARRCEAAGADGIFVPLLDPYDVPAVTHAVSLPVTVDAGDGWGPPAVGWARAGVRRINASAPARNLMLGSLRLFATQAYTAGTFYKMRGP